MATPERLGSAGTLYVTSVVLGGIIVVLHSLWDLALKPVPWQWAMLAVLTLLSGSFTVRIPGISARLSVSDTFVFAAVLLFGPTAATMIVVLDTLVISFWLRRRSSAPSRLFFNVAAPAVAIWTASHTFYFVTGIQPLSIAPKSALSVVLPLFGLATLYFLLNSWLVAFAVSIHRRQSAFYIWKENFLWLSLNYFSGASVAALLLPYLLQANTYEAFLYVTGVLLPVLLIFYLTFKAALGRVDDANRHLVELNKLYLSTIETLAMAIDAKDQITHGHIRRVQQYAVLLAKYLGVTEQAQISAIEAASLLHDMGKLAVPEYILNKPGKLTFAEFEKMKLHASVGADILSAIDFPYPVVPIVRHHHENWDGSGYPDGLRSTNIPIGARILSVVDCFDALTSDRPYRPKLQDSDAIDILIKRRGTMYDPLVVDAFIQVHSSTVSVRSTSQAKVGDGLSAIARGVTATDRTDRSARLDEIAASTEEMVVLYELATALTGRSTFRDAADTISAHIRRLVPVTTCIFFLYEPSSDQLVATHATGENGPQFVGLRIHRGERLSGWVAANKKTIMNSDPVLDLGDLARNLTPRLQSGLSTPLLNGDQLLGVLSLYAANVDSFTDDHRRVIEVVARQSAQPLRQTVTVGNREFAENISGLRSPESVQETASTDFSPAANVSIVIVSLRPMTAVDVELMDPSVARVAGVVRRGLRTGDVLVRYKRDQFLVLLPQTDPNAALLVVTRIRALLIEESRGDQVVDSLNISLGMATAPMDGASIDALVACASSRERPALDSPTHGSIH